MRPEEHKYRCIATIVVALAAAGMAAFTKDSCVPATALIIGTLSIWFDAK